MINLTTEWREASSKNRIKFLNVTSNKRKLFKLNTEQEDSFFIDFLQFQKEVVKENATLSSINLNEGFEIYGEENLQQNNAVIYCSFRLGAFMQIPLFLLDRKVDLIILVSKESHQKTVDILAENNLSDAFELIVINDPTGFRKVIKESKNGKSFFCLMDVGSALNKDKFDNKNHTIVDLNGVKIETMIGIPYLAYILNLPLVPVVSYRNSQNTVIKIEKVFTLPDVNDRFDYGRKATYGLWKQFESYVNQYPSQWESLYYIHRYYSTKETENLSIKDRSINTVDTKFKFNATRFDFITREGQFYLFDYDTNETILTSEYLYTFLYKIAINDYTLTLEELKSFIQKETTMDYFFTKNILVSV